MKKTRSPIYYEETFFLTLNGVQNVVHKCTEEALKEAGVTVSEYTLLRVIENKPGITATESRSKLYATAPSIAQLVSALERQKLIKRTPDLDDARVQHLELTAKGTQAVAKGKHAVVRMIHELELPDGLVESIVTDLQLLSSSLPAYAAK